MIKRRAITLFVVALGLAIGAALLANKWIHARLVPVAEAGTMPVIVAALDIPFGQPIEAAHVKAVNWPTDNLPEGVYHDIAEVEGKVPNQRIFEGEPLMQGRIVDHVEGSTLSAIIKPSMRAVTVRVNDVIGVAGFLLPGNRVDVIASRKVNKRAQTQTILENLKVLAVDQTASPDKDKPIVVRAVTLQMSPEQAERLVKATTEGSVQLALRNPKDESKVVKSKPETVVKSTPRHRARSYVRSVTVVRGTSVKKVRL